MWFAARPRVSLIFRVLSVSDVADHPGWYARDDSEVRNIFCDDSTGRYKGTFTNCYPAKDGCVRSNRCLAFDARKFQLPVIVGLGRAVRICCLGEAVIGEHDAMSDEDFVFNCDAFANECVGRNLAAFANKGALLDFDKCTNPTAITYLAPVQVDEIRMMHCDVPDKFDTVRYWHLRSPKRLMTQQIASVKPSAGATV